MSRRIGLLFFASGAVAVGFEVLWAKQLARVLGGSTSAIAFVLAVFMAGMGAGYLLGGRAASRLGRPILAYGVAELALASSALVSVHLIPSFEGASPLAAHALSAVAILPSSMLAGFTLPLLVEASAGSVGRALGSLYALNTAGAVSGVLVTGLVLVGALGLRASAWALALVGVSVGLTAIALGRGAGAREREASSAPRLHGGRAWLSVASLAGVASLAEEVLWARALVVHFNSSTYALTIVLAIFLAGLALGAALAARWIRSGRSPAALLVASQVGAGFLVLVGPELLELVELAIPGYVGVSQVTDLGAWLASLGVGLLRASLVLLPPTLLIGLALPLAAELYAGSSPTRRGEAAGRVTALNTLGAVLGSLLARFALLPLWGLGGGMRAAALLHASIALLVILAARGTLRRQASLGRWLALPACLALALGLRAPTEPFVGRLTDPHEVIFVDEGVQDTTAVVEMLDGSRQIFSNGISYAGDNAVAQRYMRLLGHLPALRARERGRALVICVGTGMTAAAVTRHPFERIDVVDISPVVRRTLPLFERSNDRFFEDPRVRLHIEDGRVFTARQPRGHYDVITLEPPPPRAAGVAALYSVELYETARARLTEGGAMAQWLPLHGMTRAELELLTRTFLEVFPDAEFILLLDPVEAALIATRGEGAPPALRAERAAEPRVAEHLERLGAPNPDALPRVSAEALSRVIGRGPLVTDDHPRIEHFAPALMRPGAEPGPRGRRRGPSSDEGARGRDEFLDALGL